jgi:hypothetical protein
MSQNGESSGEKRDRPEVVDLTCDEEITQPNTPEVAEVEPVRKRVRLVALGCVENLHNYQDFKKPRVNRDSRVVNARCKDCSAVAYRNAHVNYPGGIFLDIITSVFDEFAM